MSKMATRPDGFASAADNRTNMLYPNNGISWFTLYVVKRLCLARKSLPSRLNRPKTWESNHRWWHVLVPVVRQEKGKHSTG